MLFDDLKQTCVLSLEVVMGGYDFLQTHGLYIFHSSPMTNVRQPASAPDRASCIKW